MNPNLFQAPELAFQIKSAQTAPQQAERFFRRRWQMLRVGDGGMHTAVRIRGDLAFQFSRQTRQHRTHTACRPAR